MSELDQLFRPMIDRPPVAPDPTRLREVALGRRRRRRVVLAVVGLGLVATAGGTVLARQAVAPTIVRAVAPDQGAVDLGLPHGVDLAAGKDLASGLDTPRSAALNYLEVEGVVGPRVGTSVQAPAGTVAVRWSSTGDRSDIGGGVLLASGRIYLVERAPTAGRRVWGIVAVTIDGIDASGTKSDHRSVAVRVRSTLDFVGDLGVSGRAGGGQNLGQLPAATAGVSSEFHATGTVPLLGARFLVIEVRSADGALVGRSEVPVPGRVDERDDTTTLGPAVSPDDPLVPVDPAIAGPPGMPLSDGFVVVDGSTLIGPVSPVWIGPEGVSHGSALRWRALLWLTEDPMVVMRRYLVQAETLGFRRSTELGHDLGGNDLDSDAGSSEPCTPEGDESRCEVVLVRGPGAWPGAGGSVRLATEQRTLPDGSVERLLVLSGLPIDPEATDDRPANVQVSSPAESSGSEPPTLPSSGEALGRRWGPLAAVTVPDGATVAAAVAHGGDGAPPMAVFTAEDGVAVGEEFTAQLAARAVPVTLESRGTSEIDGTRLGVFNGMDSAGRRWELVVLTPPDGPTLLALSVRVD